MGGDACKCVASLFLSPERIRVLASFLKRFARAVWSAKSYIVIAAALVIFFAVWEKVSEGDVNRLDAMAYQVFVVHLRRPWLTDIMEGISNLASPVVVLMMLVMVAAFAPGRRPGMAATLNVAGALLINQVLKFIVQRPRPDGFRLVSEVGYSFPSGHSMISMAFYGFCAWMVWHYERDRLMKWFLCLCFGCAIGLVGISRIYLGVHYASDVLAGFCVSIAWVGIFTKVICPFLMPEPHEMHIETEQDPYYVEPKHLYYPEPTKVTSPLTSEAVEADRAARSRHHKKD